MGVQFAAGQTEAEIQRVFFKILDTSGTPTITAVCPLAAAASLSIVDTGTGVYDVTIKNFKGKQGVANVQATAHLISTMASCTARSYTGDALAVTIKVEDDASSATDSSVDVTVVAF